VKIAVQVVAAVNTFPEVNAGVQFQPTNVEPPVAVAVRVTAVEER
jgi:hypothetical protein